VWLHVLGGIVDAANAGAGAAAAAAAEISLSAICLN